MTTFWFISIVALVFIFIITFDDIEIFILMFIIWLFFSIIISGAIWDSNRNPNVQTETFEVTK